MTFFLSAEKYPMEKMPDVFSDCEIFIKKTLNIFRKNKQDFSAVFKKTFQYFDMKVPFI